MKGANLVFRVDGEFVQEDPLIRAAWDRHYSRSEGEKTQCLVTGKQDVPEPVHPFIKGVVGAQTSGAAIISFNAPSGMMCCTMRPTKPTNEPIHSCGYCPRLNVQ